MPGYISEFRPVGDTSQEFIEVALPAGTDPTGYLVSIYQSDGTLVTSYSLGSVVATIAGQDVYLVDAGTPGFDDGGADPTGRMYPDDGVALTDGVGGVLQFSSYNGNTVTATNGPAAGSTSTSVGSVGAGQSLQSDDGGASYYTQASPNSGTIPACFGPGSLIETPHGPRPIEDLVAGDDVLTVDGEIRVIRWVWRGTQALDDVDRDQKPVLLRKDTFGPAQPSADLVVSGQHRIVLGGYGQLPDYFDVPVFAPAKSLAILPGVRLMAGKRHVTWHHILCDDHCVIWANGVATETMLMGAVVLRGMNARCIADLSARLGREIAADTDENPALPCMTVRQTQRIIVAQNGYRVAGIERLLAS